MADFNLVPVDHDPFEGDLAAAAAGLPQRHSGTQQWQSAIEEQRQRDLRKPSIGEQVADIANNTVRIMGAPILNQAQRMQNAFEHGIDWNDPEQVKQASGGTLLDMMGLVGGTAGAAERGTVGALGGKPGITQAARNAVPMARDAAEAATYVAPPGLRSEMRNLALTGKHGYRESSETAGELAAKQMAWMRGEIDGPFPETLGEVTPRGKIDVRSRKP